MKNYTSNLRLTQIFSSKKVLQKVRLNFVAKLASCYETSRLAYLNALLIPT